MGTYVENVSYLRHCPISRFVILNSIIKFRTTDVSLLYAYVFSIVPRMYVQYCTRTSTATARSIFHPKYVLIKQRRKIRRCLRGTKPKKSRISILRQTNMAAVSTIHVTAFKNCLPPPFTKLSSPIILDLRTKSELILAQFRES